MQRWGRRVVSAVAAVVLVAGCRTGFPSVATDGAPPDRSLFDTTPSEGLDSAPPDALAPSDGSIPDALPDVVEDGTMDAFDAGDGGPADVSTDGDGCIEAYLDMDGDGYGTGPAIRPCPGGSGFSTRNGDCDDGDDRVFPTQPLFFPSPRPGGGFDYDCNGADQAEYRLEYLCAAGSPDCLVLRRGFYPPVPTCGVTGTLVLDCVGTDSCSTIDSATVQRCH